MFVQVIEAKAKDAGALKKHFEAWDRDVRPKAIGFLGSTGGVSADGTLIVAARFESKEAAQQNSDLSEQSAWWEAVSSDLEDPKFYDCEEVDMWSGGGSNDAGFVQVIQGYANDKDKLREMGRQMEESGSMERSDVIGGYVAWGPDDGFSQFIYFTSEAEARKNEAEGDGPPSEWNELLRDVRYLDLKEPWFTG